MKKNEFLLPDELGWACNDEISGLMKKKLFKIAQLAERNSDDSSNYMLLEVGIAEIIDDMYAIIKKYQKEKATHVS